MPQGPRKRIAARPGGGAGFVPTVKLDPSAVRDYRADTKSERAGIRMSQPKPKDRSEALHRMGRASMTTKPGRRNQS